MAHDDTKEIAKSLIQKHNDARNDSDKSGTLVMEEHDYGFDIKFGEKNALQTKTLSLGVEDRRISSRISSVYPSPSLELHYINQLAK